MVVGAWVVVGASEAWLMFPVVDGVSVVVGTSVVIDITVVVAMSVVVGAVM